jgi:hypothetical protein
MNFRTRIFTRILIQSLVSSCNFEYVREGDIHERTFQARDGKMKWVAMLLGLCNAQFTFQRMIGHLVRFFYTSLLQSTSMTYAFTIDRFTSGTLATLAVCSSAIQRGGLRVTS